VGARALKFSAQVHEKACRGGGREGGGGAPLAGSSPGGILKRDLPRSVPEVGVRLQRGVKVQCRLQEGLCKCTTYFFPTLVQDGD